MKTILLFLLLAVAVRPQTPLATATIDVYRAKARLVARGLHPSVYCDGVELHHQLRQGEYFTTQIPAGKHLLNAGRSETELAVDLQAGQVYYFRLERGSNNIGIWFLRL